MAKTHLSLEQWREKVAKCGGQLDKDSTILNLLFEEGAQATFSDSVNQMHAVKDGAYNYYRGLFGTETLSDWNGTAEIEDVYHDPYIPLDWSIFRRAGEFCGLETANECHTDYCQMPEGGISHLPPYQMWKWGFKTQPICIANIRTQKKVLQIAQRIIQNRFKVEEKVIANFYTYAMLTMLGHKFTLEYQNVGNGNIQPWPNNNPYNFVQGYRYAHLQPKFPSPSNLENVAPLDFSVLQYFGQGLVNARNENYVARGPRGEPVYELMYSGDWYHTNILTNPEWIDRYKYMMKTEFLPGYRMAGYYGVGEKEIVGNFSMRQNDYLPRFAESTAGGLIAVQSDVSVQVDEGVRAMPNFREFFNAPFAVAVMLGKDLGKILSRPDLRTGVEGLPIQPITGNGNWIYRNDYDKECNEDLNMPHFRKRFEMGFRPVNPESGIGILYRTQNIRLRAPNMCSLRPIIKVDPQTMVCDQLTIGCDPGEFADNNIISEAQEAGIRRVKCTYKACGDSTSLIYRLVIRREDIDSITKGQNPLQDCGCGDTINVFLGDEETGNPVRTAPATIIDIFRPNIQRPHTTYVVRFADVLAEGECPQFVACQDDSPALAEVMACEDMSDNPDLALGEVRFNLDSAINCGVGEDVVIKYYNDAGTKLGADVVGTIVEFNPETFTYLISSTDTSGPVGNTRFNCVMRAGAVRTTVQCE